jgi:hypothetical protein
MVETIEDIFAHSKAPAKIVSEEGIGGKVVVHLCQMAAPPIAVEHLMTLDRSLEIENMLLRTVHICKERLHHCLIRAFLLTGRAVR